MDSRSAGTTGAAGARRRGAAAGGVILVLLGAALAAACGGDVGGGAPSAAASPGTSPASVKTYAAGRLPAAARRALTAYFDAVAAQDQQAAAALLTPGSPLRDDPLMQLRALRDLRIDTTLFATPPPGASAIVLVRAFLAARGETAWGPPGHKEFFMVLTESPGGGWLVDHMATGP